MSAQRLRLVRCGLLATATCIPLATAYAQEGDSPFAGAVELQELASTPLSWAQPVYEEPAAAVESAALSARGPSGEAVMAQSATNSINGLLPPGVTVRAEGGEASFLLIGVPASAAGPTSPLAFPESIDPDQERELNEQIDQEQVDELSRGQAGPAPVQKWIINYPVSFEGIPVSHFADVTAFVDESGNIETLRKQNLPTSVNAETPTVSPAAARDAAVADAGSLAQGATITDPELEVWVNPDGRGQLAYRIEITSPDLINPAARRYWISAVEQPSVIYWETLVWHTHTGQVTGTIWTGSGLPNAPTANRELPNFRVNRSTGGSASTGANGLYSYTTGVGVATMNSTLNDLHTHARVDNVAGAEMMRSSSGTPANQINLSYNASGEEEIAQTSGFYWVTRTLEFAQGILAPTDLPSLQTNVNINGQCNAFWNGTSVSFFKSGGGCPNMAYTDVVAHEVGHGIDARKGGIQNGGYSEGFGDAMAVLVTRQSCVGRDFFGAGTCLRNAADVILWPLAPGDGVHAQGRRYAGFAFELIEQLKNTYGDDSAYGIAAQLILAAAKANPVDIPDAVKLSFIADDDDGDLTNGTPHFDELAAAADSRHIPRPLSPVTGVGRVGFAWANNPIAATYAPSATYAYNKGGGPITATRSGVGQYAMVFGGLGGQGTAGGNVQVTAYGATSSSCRVVSWSSAGADFAANVRCFTAAGVGTDTRYTILVTWP